MFGKLLLRRLPGNDKMNRELAKDILIQSDRLVDLLLPIDSMTRQQSLGPSASATAAKTPYLLQGAQEPRKTRVDEPGASFGELGRGMDVDFAVPVSWGGEGGGGRETLLGINVQRLCC